MLGHRRAAPLAVFVLLLLLLYLYHPRYNPASTPQASIYAALHHDHKTSSPALPTGVSPPAPIFTDGATMPMGYEFTKTLVMGRLAKDDIAWLDEEVQIPLNRSIYVVDDPDIYDDSDPHHLNSIPLNKGHEGMVYLTYIIDHYASLPDVMLFFHPHRYTWHNNVLLDLDNARMIRQMSAAHITRVGYMPGRCHHDPGCPNWLHLDRPEAEWDLIKKGEEPYFTSQVWQELHPWTQHLPASISGPCCAQFAVSRDRVLAQPLSEYVRYRDWLLHTDLEDEVSGRIMEYSWQYIWTGEAEYCPSQHVCYCDGYGVCFGTDKNLQDWMDLLDERTTWDVQVEAYRADGQGESKECKTAEDKANHINNRLNELRAIADEAGKDPAERARQSGRTWKAGDGY